MDVCPDCGGEMVGDGYTSAIHCENAPEEWWFYNEPDANPVYCEGRFDWATIHYFEVE